MSAELKELTAEPKELSVEPKELPVEPKDISVEMKDMCLEPTTMSFFNNCQICGKPDGHFYGIESSFGIHACSDHKTQAISALKNWMHKRGFVRWQDAINDPLFTVAKDLIESYILVRRSNGALEDDWMLMKPSLFNMASVKRSRSCGKWYMTAIQDYTDSERAILVEDLKLSLPEANHGLVDAFIQRLDSGFYINESAFQE